MTEDDLMNFIMGGDTAEDSAPSEAPKGNNRK